MALFLGIDLGTQSVKVAVFDEEGRFLSCTSREYPILTPQTGYAEQEPDIWWEKTVDAVREGMETLPEKNVRAISFSGQMHGMVLLDETLRPLCPSIIWCDQRSFREVEDIRERLGHRLAELAGSDIFTGFMAASFLWVKNHRPEVYRKIRWCMLPKDYLKIKMGLAPSSDVADASDTLLFDINTRHWSEEIIEALELDPSFFPPLHESSDVIGVLSQKTKEELGIMGEALVIAGAGDQHCAALGNGLSQEGDTLITIGTGGQVFTSISTPVKDPDLRIHTFCHAIPHTWHLLGASLCAGLSLSWFKKSVLDQANHPFHYSELDQEAEKVPAGGDGLLFLPYLIGERTPYKDSFARGAFLNLHLTHQRGHFIRAIMEGVGFALNNSVDIFRSLGVSGKRFIFAGGGAKSELWKQIIASIVGNPLITTTTREEAATGAAILAMMGSHHFPSFDEAMKTLIHYHEPVSPVKEWEKIYQEQYQTFQALYPALKPFFPRNDAVLGMKFRS
ncbi:MAG: xylulokinase [Candidatus Atribacteria bacterium]|nr:xylulokinase [Candidatus Atribacteria bacterium]